MPRDIPALHRLIESAYRGQSARGGWTHEADLLDGQRTDTDALGVVIADPDQRMIVAESETAIIGCVQIADRGTGTCYLGYLTVDPKLQGAGMGRALVYAAEVEASSTFNASWMEMTVIRQRGELIAWYQRLGYSLTGEQRPFPLDDSRFGLPRIRDIVFVVLLKTLIP